jgi:hypothetical protein
VTRSHCVDVASLEECSADSDELLDARDAAAWVRLARRGDFDAAWGMSDRILARHAARPRWDRPRHLQSVWQGTPLHGHVLVRCYHGLGDTLQFIRYAPLVKSVARELTVWAQPSLLPLLATVAGIDQLLPLHDGIPEVQYDIDVEVMELPYVFRSTVASLPATAPYLHARPALLPDRYPHRIGIVWRAGDWDANRSIPFPLLRTLLDAADVRWYELQHGLRPDERHWNLSVLGEATLLETARFMRALDLVISIDSMPAHLAGALGVPVWTLLPCDADWRWMEQRSDSPWYPTMRLFRQPGPGDWPAVLTAVRGALTDWVVGR